MSRVLDRDVVVTTSHSSLVHSNLSLKSLNQLSSIKHPVSFCAFFICLNRLLRSTTTSIHFGSLKNGGVVFKTFLRVCTRATRDSPTVTSSWTSCRSRTKRTHPTTTRKRGKQEIGESIDASGLDCQECSMDITLPHAPHLKNLDLFSTPL